MGPPAYLDTSALAKLVLAEPESPALEKFLADSALQVVSSEIAEIELLRAVARSEEVLLARAVEVLTQIVLLPLTSAIKRRASNLRPPAVRTLDAIHISPAAEIQAELSVLVSYDNRMNEAARSLGLTIEAPV